MTEFNADHIN